MKIKEVYILAQKRSENDIFPLPYPSFFYSYRPLFCLNSSIFGIYFTLLLPIYSFSFPYLPCSFPFLPFSFTFSSFFFYIFSLFYFPFHIFPPNDIGRYIFPIHICRFFRIENEVSFYLSAFLDTGTAHTARLRLLR